MSTAPGRQPNILFIHVDEMRFPMHFPKNVHNAGEFLPNFMPNLHSIWKKGVKFTRYYTGAADCTNDAENSGMTIVADGVVERAFNPEPRPEQG